MHFSAKRGIAIACRLSVRPTVTLVDQDHTGPKSWKLIARNLASTFTRSIRTKAHKKFGEKGAWLYPGTAHFFGYPLLSQERTSNFACTFMGSIGTKAH